jgi:hypothetical protein
LIERHTVQHSSSFHLRSRWCASQYTGFSDTNTRPKIRFKGRDLRDARAARTDFLSTLLKASMSRRPFDLKEF